MGCAKDHKINFGDNLHNKSGSLQRHPCRTCLSFSTKMSTITVNKEQSHEACAACTVANGVMDSHCVGLEFLRYNGRWIVCVGGLMVSTNAEGK